MAKVVALIVEVELTCYLGIRPSVCKLREDKLGAFEINARHANFSPGQATPFHQSNYHRGVRCSCRGTTCGFKGE